MGANERNLSCPAVSQISNLTVLSSVTHIFAKKAATHGVLYKSSQKREREREILPPMVASLPSTNVSVAYFVIMLDFPTAESPIDVVMI